MQCIAISVINASMNRQKYLDKLKKESEKLTYTKLAAKVGVHYVTLWRVIKGKSPGDLKFWDAIFAHYKRPRKKPQFN